MKRSIFGIPAASTISAMLAMSLTGCLQGQSYTRPPIETPTDWSHMASGPLIADASGTTPEADWWRAFRNEELTQFVERALTHAAARQQQSARPLPR